MVSQEKWEKTQLLTREVKAMLELGHLPLQRLLEIRGFPVYVVRTYSWMNPYIKGLHLTVNSWRPGRGESGFKLKGKELARALKIWAADKGLPCRREGDALEEAAPAGCWREGEAPVMVDPVPRLVTSETVLCPILWGINLSHIYAREVR